MTDSTAGTMKLVGGDPCLDFVNTVGGRISSRASSSTASLVRNDKLASYGDLLAWAGHAGLLDERASRKLARHAAQRPREASRVLSRAVAGREALHRALSSLMEGRPPAPGDLAILNGELATLRRHERLVAAEDGLRWEPARSGSRLDSVLWPVWRAAALLLTSEDGSRLRRCGGEDCGWLFLDHSKNHSRRWCTMEDCGNVSKVRRFRRRRRRRT
jgi:predicted RNA-binding Zn ribbon-like protein